MSERNLTPLLISGSASDSDDTATDDLTEDLDLGFDGAEDILRAWRRGMRPDPDLTVSEWADQHRKLSSRASAEPGQYRTARTPSAPHSMVRRGVPRSASHSRSASPAETKRPRGLGARLGLVRLRLEAPDRPDGGGCVGRPAAGQTGPGSDATGVDGRV